MITCWAAWKPFPSSENGGHLDAPIGPGVYEVRHAATGALIAFSDSAQVAQALTTVVSKPSGFDRLLGRRKKHRATELEYRTCSATSVSEARIVAEQLRGRRETYWRRRSVAWA